MSSDLVPHVVLFVTKLERENYELKSQLKEKESQLKENEFQLKEQEDERLLVQITGPNRTPIYYEGSLKNGYSIGNALWFLNIERKNDGVVHLPLSSCTNLEIWSGGIVIENFQDVGRLYGVDFSQDNNGSGMGIGEIAFVPGEVFRRGKRRPVHVIHASIGPMTFADYNKLTDEQLDLQEQIASHKNLDLEIDGILFCKEKISGIMSLLEKLGISTLDDDSDSDDDDVENDDGDDDDDSANDSDE